MSTILKDGFYFFDNIKREPDFLILTKSNLNNELKYIYENKIKNIAITNFHSENIEDFSFFKELNFIEKLILNDIKIQTKYIYFLEKLKYLRISLVNEFNKVDFSNFHNIETIVTYWSNSFNNYDKCKLLKSLSIRNFSPKDKNTYILKLPMELKEFRIVHSNILWFELVEVPNLLELELSYCKQLKNLIFNNEQRKNLKTLEIDCCKKLENYEVLAELHGLEKLMISDSAPIKSLKFIEKMPNLKFLSFVGTNVLDGDLSYLTKLDYAGFDNKKHFSHKFEEMKKIINERKISNL